MPRDSRRLVGSCACLIRGAFLTLVLSAKAAVELARASLPLGRRFCRPCGDKANDRQACAPRKTSNSQSVPLQTSARAGWELAQPVRPWLLRNCGQGAPGDGGHFVDCDPHIPEQGPPKGRRYPPPSSSGRRRRQVLVDAIRPSGLHDGFAPGLGGARGWPRPGHAWVPVRRAKTAMAAQRGAARCKKMKITPGALDRRPTVDADAQSRDQVRLGQVYQRPRQP